MEHVPPGFMSDDTLPKPMSVYFEEVAFGFLEKLTTAEPDAVSRAAVTQMIEISHSHQKQPSSDERKIEDALRRVRYQGSGSSPLYDINQHLALLEQKQKAASYGGF